MGIVITDYPAMPSPGACPKCGSMDLFTPYHGRRTSLWFSSCRDCKTQIRSRGHFTVERRIAPTVITSNASGFDSLRDASREALNRLNALDPKLRQMREIGEEG